MVQFWITWVASICKGNNSSKHANDQENLHDESNFCSIVNLERDWLLPLPPATCQEVNEICKHMRVWYNCSVFFWSYPIITNSINCIKQPLSSWNLKNSNGRVSDQDRSIHKTHLFWAIMYVLRMPSPSFSLFLRKGERSTDTWGLLMPYV